MTDRFFAPAFSIDWPSLPDDVYEAALLAYRMASDRERGWMDCPGRACRRAAACRGAPERQGERPCQAPLTPFAWGHAADHWHYAIRLMEEMRAR